MIRITSTGNKAVKEVRELIKKAKVRREKGLFVAEGERLCAEIPEDRIEEIFLADGYHGRMPAGISEDDPRILTVSLEVMEAMSDTKTSQGILCVVRQKTYERLQGDFFMILENLQDPGNMGTIFRTAEAAGVNGIIMNRECVDLYSPKVVRSTMGAMFRMPFLIVPDLQEEVRRLKSEGVQVYAAHLKGTKNHFQFDYHTPTAFMIGNEGNGLSDELSSLADQYLRIPMHGKTESLNAAVAATVLMYEVLRQRT